MARCRHGPNGRPGDPDPLHAALDAVSAAALLERVPREVRAAMLGYGLFSLAAALLTDRPERWRRAMGLQVPLPLEARLRVGKGPAHKVTPGLTYRRLGIVDVAFLRPPDAGDRGRVLVDAGLPGSAGTIARAAAVRFDPGARPAAIAMTHGHFDHTGALEHLAEEWDAPVYAHPAEHPHLDGTTAYPPGEPSVGGDAMAAVAGPYPTAPVNVAKRLHAMTEGAAVPFASGWRWLHTPGHAPGRASLWREETARCCPATRSSRPGRRRPVPSPCRRRRATGPRPTSPPAGTRCAPRRALAALEPEVILAGHGAPLAGLAMRGALRRLARNFDALAIPEARGSSLPPNRSEGRA